jgi:beta-glucanase (GH16 family)
MLARLAVLLLVSGTMAGHGAAAAAERLDRAQWRLTFEEEFSGPLSLWDGRDGRWKTEHMWGDTPINEELQYYVDPRVHGIDPFVLADGILTIRAAPTPPGFEARVAGRPYTSGIVTTEMSFRQKYGLFEIRCRMPRGKGLWPAFWLLPKLSGPMPAPTTGLPEIDVVEFLGHDPDRYYATIHPMLSGQPTEMLEHDAVDLSLDFHTYAVVWEEDRTTFYFDGVAIGSRPTPVSHTWSPAFLIANLAVGGRWPGNPDRNTRFPGAFAIDYIRVYERIAPK